jgi:hypothetical protein
MVVPAMAPVNVHQQCEQRHVTGGSKLNSALVEGTEAETQAWFVGAFELAHARLPATDPGTRRA